jgi:hypothetical protein
MQPSEFDTMSFSMGDLFDFLGIAINQSNDPEEKQEYIKARNRVRKAIRLIQDSSPAIEHAMVRYE